MKTDKPLIIMIDDDIYFLEAWRETLGENVYFRGFSSPFEFEDSCDENDQFLKAKCIIIDFNFGNENAGELDIVSFLKKKRYLGKIIMCSIFEDFGDYHDQVKKDFDLIIKKKPLAWEKLLDIITNS